MAEGIINDNRPIVKATITKYYGDGFPNGTIKDFTITLSSPYSSMDVLGICSMSSINGNFLAFIRSVENGVINIAMLNLTGELKFPGTCTFEILFR